jgi:high-affinity iron transporter
MRHKERHGHLPVVDPLLNRLRGRKAAEPRNGQQDVEVSAIPSDLETESKVPKNGASLI